MTTTRTADLDALLRANPVTLWLRSDGLSGPLGALIPALIAFMVAWLTSAGLAGDRIDSMDGMARFLTFAMYAIQGIVGGVVIFLVAMAFGTYQFERALKAHRRTADIMLKAGNPASEVTLFIADTIAIAQGRTDGHPRGV